MTAAVACRTARMSHEPTPAPSARSTVATWLVGQPDLVDAVQVQIASLGVDDRSRRRLGQLLGRDQVLPGGKPYVADVDPAEQAMPVTVVRLALVQVVARPVARLPLRHRRDQLGDRQHPLVEVVDLAVLHLVAPGCTPQPASLGALVVLRSVEDLIERSALLGRQRPHAHLGV